jgi:hypothetical protein
MAVDKTRVIARLKAYIAGKANLSNVRIDEVSARLALLPADDADDAAIDAVITNADAIYPFKEISSNDDRFRNLESQIKKPVDPNNPNPEPNPQPTPNQSTASDAPDYIKTLMATIEGLKADIVEVKTGKVLETKRSAATQAFEKSETLKALKTPELKQAWLNRINVDSETPIEEQITALESEYTVMQQTFADSIGYSGTPPLGGNHTLKPDEKMIENIVDSF